MTRFEFMALCGELLIDVGIALESEEVVQALDEGKSYKEIKELLIEITQPAWICVYPQQDYLNK